MRPCLNKMLESKNLLAILDGFFFFFFAFKSWKYQNDILFKTALLSFSFISNNNKNLAVSMALSS